MIDDHTRDRTRDEHPADIIKGAKKNDLDEVEQAIGNNRKDLNLVDPETGFTALQYAVSRGNLRIVKFLLKQEEVEIKRKDLQGRTVLELAVEVGHQGIISELLRAKATRDQFT